MIEHDAICWALRKDCAVLWEFWMALAAFAAAFATYRAARVALKISNIQRSDQIDRERRDVLPLAIAIHAELMRVRIRIASLDWRSNQPNLTVEGNLRNAVRQREDFRIASVSEALVDLGCFPPVVAKKVVDAYVACESVRNAIPDKSEPLPLVEVGAMLYISGLTAVALPLVNDALAALDPLTAILNAVEPFER